MHILTISVSVLLVVATIAIVVLLTLATCADYFDRIRWARKEVLTSRLTYKVEELASWCSWYFPITEDIETYLLGDNEGIDRFRERMWNTYGKREVSGPVPGPQTSGPIPGPIGSPTGAQCIGGVRR